MSYNKSQSGNKWQKKKIPHFHEDIFKLLLEVIATEEWFHDALLHFKIDQYATACKVGGGISSGE